MFYQVNDICVALAYNITVESNDDHLRALCIAIGKHQPQLSKYCFRKIDIITEGARTGQATTRLLFSLILSKVAEAGLDLSVSATIKVIKESDDPTIVSSLKQGLSRGLKSQ